MTARVHHFIRCDAKMPDGFACMAEWSSPRPVYSATELRAYLKTVGWRRDKGDDICPDCWTSRLAATAPTSQEK